MPTLVVIDNSFLADGFVQDRVRGYLENGFDVRVFVCGPAEPLCPERRWASCAAAASIERFDSTADLSAALVQVNPDAVLAHFLTPDIARLLDRYAFPAAIWYHGGDVQHWMRRWYNYRIGFYANPKLVRRAIHGNQLQRSAVRRTFWRENRVRTLSIFVSHWLQTRALEDLGFLPRRRLVIPNPVDDEFFEPQTGKKFDQDDLRVLSIRSYSQRNYATDRVADIVHRVNRDERLRNVVRFEIVGVGSYWDRDTRGLAAYPNVTLRNDFLNKSQIREAHARNSIWLYPTRADSQGVSLGEAMASCLVPLVSPTEGITEFVSDERSGMHCPNMRSFVDNLRRLHVEPGLGAKLGFAAREAIQESCGKRMIISREVEAIRSLLVPPSPIQMSQQRCK